MTIGIEIAYLIASVLFIIGIKYLGKTKDARKGNVISAVGMVIAIAATLFTLEVLTLLEIGIAILVGSAIGLYYAQKVAMTKIPEMVALISEDSQEQTQKGMRLSYWDMSILHLTLLHSPVLVL